MYTYTYMCFTKAENKQIHVEYIIYKYINNSVVHEEERYYAVTVFEFILD